MADELIATIYSAILEPELWPEVVQRTMQKFDCTMAGFFIQTPTNELGDNILLGCDVKELQRYNDYYAACNPWFTKPGLMQPQVILSDIDLDPVYLDRNYFSNTEFYNDWAKPQDYRYFLGGTIHDQHGSRLNFTLIRPHGAAAFGNEEKNALSSLHRHLAKAIELGSRLAELGTAKSFAELALDRISFPVVNVDRFGKVKSFNSAAQKYLKDQPLFGIVNYQFRFANASLKRKFESALLKAILSGNPDVILINRQTGPTISIAIVPEWGMRAKWCEPQVGANIFISDPRLNTTLTPERLRWRWGLSPKEACVAFEFYQGFGVREIAERLGISYETTRWYLKQIMQKLSVKRQSELLALLIHESMFQFER